MRLQTTGAYITNLNIQRAVVVLDRNTMFNKTAYRFNFSIFS